MLSIQSCFSKKITDVFDNFNIIIQIESNEIILRKFENSTIKVTPATSGRKLS